MKATLTFNLPEEESEHRCAINGNKYWCLLWEIDQFCRGQLKYGTKFKKVDDVFEHIREMIPYELMEEIG